MASALKVFFPGNANKIRLPSPIRFSTFITGWLAERKGKESGEREEKGPPPLRFSSAKRGKLCLNSLFLRGEEGKKIREIWSGGGRGPGLGWAGAEERR